MRLINAISNRVKRTHIFPPLLWRSPPHPRHGATAPLLTSQQSPFRAPPGGVGERFRGGGDGSGSGGSRGLGEGGERGRKTKLDYYAPYHHRLIRRTVECQTHVTSDFEPEPKSNQYVTFHKIRFLAFERIFLKCWTLKKGTDCTDRKSIEVINQDFA